MAVKPIGSSLVSRAPGTLTRKREELNMAKPPIPGKGEVGTAQRNLVQETNIQTVPGSEKVIRVAPGQESTSQTLPGIGNKDLNTMPGVMGQAVPASAPGSAPGTPTPAMFANVSPNAPAPKAGTAPKVLGMATQNTAPIKAAGVQGGQTTAQATNPQDVVGSFWPGAAALGGRVSADEPNAGGEVAKNFGQAFWGTVGNVGQKLGIVSPATNAKMQSYATNPAVTKSGVGSISQPAKGVQAVVQSPGVQNVLRSVSQAINNTTNQLRSALSKLKFW